MWGRQTKTAGCSDTPNVLAPMGSLGIRRGKCCVRTGNEGQYECGSDEAVCRVCAAVVVSGKTSLGPADAEDSTRAAPDWCLMHEAVMAHVEEKDG